MSFQLTRRGRSGLSQSWFPHFCPPALRNTTEEPGNRKRSSRLHSPGMCARSRALRRTHLLRARAPLSCTRSRSGRDTGKRGWSGEWWRRDRRPNNFFKRKKKTVKPGSCASFFFTRDDETDRWEEAADVVYWRETDIIFSRWKATMKCVCVCLCTERHNVQACVWLLASESWILFCHLCLMASETFNPLIMGE